MSSRLSMTAKNAFWNYFSMFATLLIQFISRTVFIHFLGKEYLGINGLFSNVLGVLSFAELGFGTAMNFSLYKPVAENNIEKIKSYMYYYEWAYRIIAGIVLVLGLALIPFLEFLIKDPGNIGNVKIYYVIFLFNTVTSYFVSYKYSLINAEQKNYVCTNINLITSLITTIFQIVILIIWKNYLIYLLVAAGFGLIQKIFVSIYFNKIYPYLRSKSVVRLSKEEEKTLITKVKALVVHKFGDICVHQTDNIIVSAFIDIGTVGLLSNYNLIINTIRSCINVLFNSATGSLGNLIATESEEKQYEIFQIYRFIGFWFFGFTSIGLMTLLSPFITLWIGETMLINETVIALIMIDYYMLGHRICLNNFKIAGGVFEQDKYLAIIQSVVNIVSSIVLVKLIGLAGVFMGTILQGTISSVVKPIVVYRNLFHISAKHYFFDSLKYLCAVVPSLLICIFIRNLIFTEPSILRFILSALPVLVVPNLVFYIFFHKRNEFTYVRKTIKKAIKR